MLDDDGIDPEPVKIAVAVTISNDHVCVDFTGTSIQRKGSINAVYPITLSATAYVFRCLLGLDIPANSGCMNPIDIVAPEGTLVNAKPPAAVAGGNVETAQRIVDVLLGALAQACPERIPAASQGTMNNVTIGGWDSVRQRPFAYYETMGRGNGGTTDLRWCQCGTFSYDQHDEYPGGSPRVCVSIPDHPIHGSFWIGRKGAVSRRRWNVS